MMAMENVFFCDRNCYDYCQKPRIVEAVQAFDKILKLNSWLHQLSSLGIRLSSSLAQQT